MSETGGAAASDSGAAWCGRLIAVLAAGIAAFNLTTGVFNVFLNGGVPGQLAADAYNHHLPLLASIGSRLDAVILAGFIALVGSAIALAPLGRRTRWRVILGVVANAAAMSAVLAAFASGIELGQ